MSVDPMLAQEFAEWAMEHLRNASIQIPEGQEGNARYIAAYQEGNRLLEALRASQRHPGKPVQVHRAGGADEAEILRRVSRYFAQDAGMEDTYNSWKEPWDDEAAHRMKTLPEWMEVFREIGVAISIPGEDPSVEEMLSDVLSAGLGFELDAIGGQSVATIIHPGMGKIGWAGGGHTPLARALWIAIAQAEKWMEVNSDHAG